MPKKLPANAHLEAILDRLQALEDRIARLEGVHDAALAVAADFGPASSAPAPTSEPVAAPRPPAERSPATPPPAPAPSEDVSEETLIVISAAVAAFLGERAHVRQVRLVHTDAWAQQGRVSVMASHRWAVHR